MTTHTSDLRVYVCLLVYIYSDLKLQEGNILFNDALNTFYLWLFTDIGQRKSIVLNRVK